MKEQMVPIAAIIADVNRKNGGEGDISLLAEDMKAIGLTHAITLKEMESVNPQIAGYRIIAGRRRHAAAKLLGWEKIRAAVYAKDEEPDEDAIAASENINRLPMHALDEAEIFNRLINAGESPESLAKRFDRTKAEIFHRIKLLELGDEIKTIFRQGKLSLSGAAMLGSLDADQQKAFCKNFEKQDDCIDEIKIKVFLSGLYHDVLYKCVAGSGCQSCKKRTFYSDKGLFPEMSYQDDFCLDHECYIKNWNSLLLNRIKSIKGENKGHSGADILATKVGSELIKIFGKTVTLDGTRYQLKKTDRDNKTVDKPTKETRPCFEVTIDGGKLKVSAKYWKTAAKNKTSGTGQLSKPCSLGRPLESVVKILDLPKDEAERTVAALEADCKESYGDHNKRVELMREVRGKVLDRILEKKAKQPVSEKEIDIFLSEYLERYDIADIRKTVKLFTGEQDLINIRKKLTWPKLFLILNSLDKDKSDLPFGEDVLKDKKCELAEWAGITMTELRKMYKEELALLMPKLAPAKKAVKEHPKTKTVTKKTSGVKKTVKSVTKKTKTVKKAAPLVTRTKKADKPVKKPAAPRAPLKKKKPALIIQNAFKAVTNKKARAAADSLPPDMGM